MESIISRVIHLRARIFCPFWLRAVSGAGDGESDFFFFLKHAYFLFTEYFLFLKSDPRVPHRPACFSILGNR